MYGCVGSTSTRAIPLMRRCNCGHELFTCWQSRLLQGTVCVIPVCEAAFRRLVPIANPYTCIMHAFVELFVEPFRHGCPLHSAAEILIFLKAGHHSMSCLSARWCIRRHLIQGGGWQTSLAGVAAGGGLANLNLMQRPRLYGAVWGNAALGLVLRPDVGSWLLASLTTTTTHVLVFCSVLETSSPSVVPSTYSLHNCFLVCAFARDVV